jgi:hemerythrin-like domain-containing protein
MHINVPILICGHLVIRLPHMTGGGMTMPELLEILEQEHADMRRLLDLIKTQADTAETLDFGLLHEILEYCLAYPDQYHHPKEDLIYAALRQRDPEGAGSVDDIVAEHRELATATRELATVLKTARLGQERAGRDLRVMLRSFVRSYRDHMRKEDQEFFPYAFCTLSPEEWSNLAAEVTDPTDPLMQANACEQLDDLLARGKIG